MTAIFHIFSKKSILRNVSIISFLSGLGMIAGMGVFILLASLVGLSRQSDAFFVAFTLPSFAQSAIYSSSYAFVSSFSKALTIYEVHVAHQFYSIVLSLAFPLLLSISIVTYILAPFLVWMLAPGTESTTYTTAVELLQIMSWTPIFIGLSRIGGAMLNTSHHFTVAASTELIRFSVAIVIGLLYPGGGAYSISFGLLVGSILQLLIVMLACYYQLGFRYQPKFNYRYPGVVELAKLSWIAIQAQLIRQGTSISDRIFASFLPTGSIALIQYGARLTGPINLVFFSSVTSATMPKLASSIAKGNKTEVNRILRVTWRLIALISLPGAALLLGLNYPLVALLFQRGAFDSQAVDQVASLTFAYNLSLLFYGHLTFQTAYFYAANDKKGIIRLFTFVTIVDVVLKGILIMFVGPLASAIAFSSSVALGVVAGSYLIKQTGYVSLTDLKHYDLRLILTSLMMGVASYWVAARVSDLSLDVNLLTNIMAIIIGSSVSMGIFGIYFVFLRRDSLVIFKEA